MAVTALTLVFLLIAVALYAQTRATLHGRMLDMSGAIPGATIMLRSHSTTLDLSLRAGIIARLVLEVGRAVVSDLYLLVVERTEALLVTAEAPLQQHACDFATLVGYFASPGERLRSRDLNLPENGVRPFTRGFHVDASYT